ncbi:autotransporter-associated N-terminal domain-containing protein [Fusobacterium canifelinum]|uniref:autotransporter-associated N-terminal domain-containing protein n=1 Tax=Fusobacterium canifelinum TaxID=285729 RepID=UPI0030D205BE
MKNNLSKVEKDLRSIARRYKSVRYSIGLAVLFLMLGINAFSEETITRETIQNSVGNLQSKIETLKVENEKTLEGLRLELVQLTEQGDQVVKSPWSSWQFGLNYMYSRWGGAYKGRGDKKEKYPYEGIFARSNDLFLRSISPDSDFYEKYTAASKERLKNSATTSDRKRQGLRGSNYGLENTLNQQEPIVQIELGASVRPREIVKSPVNVTAPRITVSPVTPFSKPSAPSEPTAPTIGINEFDPAAPDVTAPDLPVAPTFNIQLGSYRNYMEQNVDPQDGGKHSGNGKSYDSSYDTNVDGSTLSVTTIYAWKSPSRYVGGPGFDSALLKAYFDYTNKSSGNGGGTATVTGNITIDSVRGSITDPNAATRWWNDQRFLVGGSRVATLDNASGGGTIRNKATINMVGPLVVGYEIQNDNAGSGKREIVNEGILTDDKEKDLEEIGGLKKGATYKLKRSPHLGGDEIDVTRTKDKVVNGQVIKGGYTGYKIGMILTQEFDDPDPGNNYYRLINDGTISFMGRNSIGIQVYAKPNNKASTIIDVINKENKNGAGEITLGGIESYGLKLSSRILREANGRKSVFENRGKINIKGGDGSENSLSSGMAVLEDTTMMGNFAIRAYKGMVVNKGTIDVSGGKGNTGMILKVNAGDDITNDTNGIINVSGTANIGMRVDKGAVNTDESGDPEAINNGTINVSGSATEAKNGNIGMVAHNQAKAINNKHITFASGTKYGTGLLAKGAGAKIENNGANAKITGSGLERTIGMSTLKDTTGSNSGTIDLNGNRVTGVYNEGTFNMTGGFLKASGEQSISLYSKGSSSITNITGGTIVAGNKAVGLYADGSTIGIKNPTKLEAHNEGLMFYNYASNNPTNPSGRFNLTGDVEGDIKSGGTAFYFKGAASNTASFLNQMFNKGQASSPGKLKLKLEDGATLFVLDSPGGAPIKLSTVRTLGTALGDKVDISRTTSNKYKAYTVYKGSLEIDEAVNLDNETDNFYKMNFTASNVTINENISVIGSKADKVIMAQANYNGATSSSTIKVTNKGKIDYSGNKSTALATDFGQVTNETSGTIRMSGDNSIGLYGAANSIVTNKGTIEMGKAGVGIWGANKLSDKYANRNINIVNFGTIRGISGKEGIFGIYAKNSHAGATSNISHSGNIDLLQAKKSTGIFMTKGTLNSSGNISVNEGSVGVNAEDSTVNVNGGTHTIGANSIGFNLKGNSSKLLANSGNISITGKGSVAYLFEGVNLTSGTNFKDNLTLTATNGYTYINLTNSTLNYKNQKTINNDETIFVNSKNSTVNLLEGNDISSTKNKVVGVYSEGGASSNAGKITLIGDRSSALYSKSGATVNGAPGKITIGTNGSGIYVVNTGSTGSNYGEITIGAGSVGMRAENGRIKNYSTGKISSTAEKATGMSQSGNENLENEGTITLTGNQSVGMHSEGVTAAGHQMINKGIVTVGHSATATSPSIGMYAANTDKTTIINNGKVIAGNKSTGIYGGNVTLNNNSETSAGNGGIGIYSKGGTVDIKENAKISVGDTLGDKQEGVGVYLAGNNQTLNSDTDNLTIGKGSFGYVMTGQGNTVRTGKVGTTRKITLTHNSIFMYSADRTGTAVNYNNLRSTGDLNYGIYASGRVDNRGTIDFSQGIGNIGAYSYTKGATTTPNSIRNYGIINVSKSDLQTNPDDRKYGIGMAAGYSEESPAGSGRKVTRGIGSIENHGLIRVTTPDSIGMYATGKGSRIYNGPTGRIELSGRKRNIGIFAENGAEVVNEGTITTVGSGNIGQIGIGITSGATLINRGNIHVNAARGYGLFVAGGIVKNYGNITVAGGAQKTKEVSAADTSKALGDEGLDRVGIKSPAGASKGTITSNGKVKRPTIVQAIPNRKPSEIPKSSIGMYLDTSGINYTKPINNVGALAGLKQGDLIVGTEAADYTNSKYIQVGQDIIKPYNEMIRKSGIEKWSIYSASLTWMASITQLPDYTIRNAYLVKIPYTVFAGDKKTTRDTYNFTDGLEQRYGVEGLKSREKELFKKLNKIGNNERILLQQAFDEMMGHQYANVQQRIYATGQILDKEFDYLRDEWKTASKDSNKMKIFGTKGEYKTDTAGVIDYKNEAYGMAYVHENEDIKLGKGIGWYTGIVDNTFKFKDIGRSKEEQIQTKVGLLKSVPFDDNNSLNWTISGDIFVGYNKMHRKYLVVNEIFNAKSKYYTYGIGIKNKISKDFRLSEDFSLVPYGSLNLEYGRVNKIKEKVGEIRLEVKENYYVSVNPEIGAELTYKHLLANRKTFRMGLGIAYENELGKVANGKNKARVAYTNADWFNIRGEKEDRKGNIKFDLNIGLDNQRVGVTANAGYDTKGHNVRGGLGLRVIF